MLQPKQPLNASYFFGSLNMGLCMMCLLVDIVLDAWLPNCLHRRSWYWIACKLLFYFLMVILFIYDLWCLQTSLLLLPSTHLLSRHAFSLFLLPSSTNSSLALNMILGVVGLQVSTMIVHSLLSHRSGSRQ